VRIEPTDIKLAPFTDAKPLVVHATGKNYGDFDLIYTAPALSNGMIVLGEVAKVVTMSAARFISITPNGATAIDLKLAGVDGETVEVYYVASVGGAVKTSSCTIDRSGSATLTLHA
jgi:hypothetical protein